MRSLLTTRDVCWVCFCPAQVRLLDQYTVPAVDVIKFPGPDGPEEIDEETGVVGEPTEWIHGHRMLDPAEWAKFCQLCGDPSDEYS